MQTLGSCRMRAAVGACGFLMMAFVAQAGSAQQPVAASAVEKPQIAAQAAAGAQSDPAIPKATAGLTGSATAKGEEEASSAEAGKTGGEGIKIHGHWVIDLKNPDGKVVEHREFENSLTTATGEAIAGSQILAALLSGNAAPGAPGIAFVYAEFPINNYQTQQCGLGLASAPTIFPCDIFTVAGSTLMSYKWAGVSISHSGLKAEVSFNSTSVNWVLSGNYTIPATPSVGIQSVGTVLPLCIATSIKVYEGSSTDGSGPTTPADCTTLAKAGDFVNGMLTFTNIPNGPLAVTAGQVISVTVTISFS